MSGDFHGKTIFISGAGRGIGRATALYLSGLGAAIGLADLDADACAETHAAILAQGGTAYAEPADLSRQASFARVVDNACAALGPLDGLVNNASILRYQPLAEIDEETVERMIGAGLKSVIWGSQALLRHRRPDAPAALLNFSSPVVYRGYPNALVYSAVKGGVAAATNVLAAELGPQGIRVNAIAPGSVPTPGARAHVAQEEYERRAASIPLRRLGREEDIAKAIAFLLGEQAEFVNGAVLSVDGGIIAAG